MTQEVKLGKLDGHTDTRRLKRTAEQPAESLRKSQYRPKLQDQGNKITHYFALKSPGPVANQSQRGPVKEEGRLQQLEEQLKEKQKQIQELRDKKQQEQQKANYLAFQTRQFKHKTTPVIAQTMLALADVKRQQRNRRDPKMGHFSSDLRSFTQGDHLSSLRKIIQQKQERMSRLEKHPRSKTKNENQVRSLSSVQFIHKEVHQLKKELEHREKEVAIYKDLVKLSEKEQKSYYAKMGWPLVYDRYQTLELLGSGGFGEVYKCYELETHKIVALKRVYFTGITDESERQEFIRHVIRQAEIQKHLDHPNIARLSNVVEVNLQDGLLVFELEHCTGPELGTYLRKYGCLEEKEAKLIMRQLFSALHYLFKLEEKVIHYDLKPSNVMFDEGVVKMLDFGLSKVMKGDETRMDLTSQGTGTYWYLPPETFEEYNPQVSPKVDVWSLGVIFFQLLYGRKPFGHGLPQSQIYNSGLILKAYKVDFPLQTPRKFKVSDSAKEFISCCLKYRQEERLSPLEAYVHSYFSK